MLIFVDKLWTFVCIILWFDGISVNICRNFLLTPEVKFRVIVNYWYRETNLQLKLHGMLEEDNTADVWLSRSLLTRYLPKLLISILYALYKSIPDE